MRIDPYRSLRKKQVASVLENFTRGEFYLEEIFHRKAKTLPEQALLDVFTDGTSTLKLKYRAASILINKQSARFVPIILEFVNTIVDADLYIQEDSETAEYITKFQYLIGRLTTPEAYEGIKKFLNRLLTENLKYHDIFIDGAIIALTNISCTLKRKDEIPLMKSALSHFIYPPNEGLISVAENFGVMNEPSLLKYILTEHLTSEMPDVEEVCLELLEELDPEFVEKWKTQKATANTQNEASE